MIRPEAPEPIEGMYDALYALALRGRELGGGTATGALASLPEDTIDYLEALRIPGKNCALIAFGLAWGLEIAERGRASG